MPVRDLSSSVVAVCCLLAAASGRSAIAAETSPVAQAKDWLVNPSPFKARISQDAATHELVLDNGLVRRVVRLSPDAATVDYQNLVSGEQLLRAVGPEARVTLNGTPYAVGGLVGQPVQNYLTPESIAALRADPKAYHFRQCREMPLTARMPWKRHPEWLSRDLPWPPHGREAILRFVPPSKPNQSSPRTDLPEIDVYYAIYDGIPLIEKWLTIRNTTTRPMHVGRTIVETLNAAESESAVDANVDWEAQNLYVETDYAYASMTAKSANRTAVRWLPDPGFHTQVNYALRTPCLLEVAPEMGPDVDLAPGKELVSIRAFELFRDGTDRERRGLAQRRMYRTIAPWTQENPVLIHLVSHDPKTIRETIDQAAAVGAEMVILSFGSGVNLEDAHPKYQAGFKKLAEYGKRKGVALGGYSLLASRGAAKAADNCGGPGSRVKFGVMPCLGSRWGKQYLGQLQSFFTNTGMAVLEHDGSYPGDTCARTGHPGHRGLGDSQWAQWVAITDFYKWCRGQGIYLNVPDWYFLNGSNKIAMGYREANWSLPRNDQEIIERQNVYDGTWEKTASMGWMFVPLTQYHGGGAAATIEPLCRHLPHYEARLANLFGAGVQACYRGTRIYDTDETRALVAKWIDFYKKHRQALDSDLIHLRRPDGRDWDGFVHVNPEGPEKALAFIHNPLQAKIVRRIRIPLYYAGLADRARVSIDGGPPSAVELDRGGTATLDVALPAHGRTWLLFTQLP